MPLATLTKLETRERSRGGESRRAEVVDILAIAALALLVDRPKTTPSPSRRVDANA